MEARTVTVTIDAPAERVFRFLADIENAPRWAVEFIQELKRDGADYRVVTPMGEMLYRVEADAGTGVIDIHVGPGTEQLALFPTRVISLPGGRSAYSFTMFRAPDAPDELFEDQYTSLQRELAGLPRLFA